MFAFSYSRNLVYSHFRIIVYSYARMLVFSSLRCLKNREIFFFKKKKKPYIYTPLLIADTSQDAFEL